MKHLFLLILILGSTILNSQDVNPTDIIPPKKERKREFFIYFYKPQLSAADEELWSGEYLERPTIDTLYFGYQDRYRYKYHFKGYRGMIMGFTKKVIFLGKLKLKYGVALNIFGFNFDYDTELLETRLLNEYRKTIASLPFEPSKKTVINKKYSNPPNNEVFYISSKRSYSVASFTVPLSIEYPISSKLFAGVDYNISFPFQVEDNSVFIDYYNQIQEYGRKDNGAIARVLVSLGLHFKYNFKEKFFVQSCFGFSNVFKGNLYNSNYNGVGSAFLINYGFALGYNF